MNYKTKKYTKREVIDQRISFKPMTKEQFKKLCNHFKFADDYFEWKQGWYYRFYPVLRARPFGRKSTSYLTDEPDGILTSSKEINFEEFTFNDFNIGDWVKTFEGKYVEIESIDEAGWIRPRSRVNTALNPDVLTLVTELPEKWAVKITDVNIKELEEIRGFQITPIFINGYMTSFPFSEDFPFGLCIQEFLLDEVIPLRMLRYFLNKSKMNKKIIGYKLSNPKYRDAVNALLKPYGNILTPKNTIVNEVVKISNILKDAGVLDIWFDPIYEKEKLFIGNYEVKFYDDYVQIGCETITVNQMQIIKKYIYDHSINNPEYNEPMEKIFDLYL